MSRSRLVSAALGALLVAIAVISLGGCGTLRGIGEDLQALATCREDRGGIK